MQVLCVLLGATLATPQMEGGAPHRERLEESDSTVAPLLISHLNRGVRGRRATLRDALEGVPTAVVFGFDAFGARYNITTLTRSVYTTDASLSPSSPVVFGGRVVRGVG
jgi:hypothetical protein